MVWKIILNLKFKGLKFIVKAKRLVGRIFLGLIFFLFPSDFDNIVGLYHNLAPPPKLKLKADTGQASLKTAAAWKTSLSLRTASYLLKDIAEEADGESFSTVNHLGPAVIHSALSITMGIDFMGGIKAEKKRQAEKEEHNVLYCKNMQPKNHHFVTHCNFLISACAYNLWDKRKRK